MRLAAALLVCVACPLAAQDFKEGQWEFNTRMSIPGLPSMEGFELPAGIQLPEGVEMPTFGRDGMAMVNRNCITRESLVPPASQAGQECKITEQQVQGGKVSWRMECDTAQGRMVGVGEGRYSGTRMNASMQMQGNVQGIPVVSDFVTEGRYLGACPAP